MTEKPLYMPCPLHVRDLARLVNWCQQCDEEGFKVDQNGKRKRCDHSSPELTKKLDQIFMGCLNCRGKGYV
jgi:hypothetical protein